MTVAATVTRGAVRQVLLGLGVAVLVIGAARLAAPPAPPPDDGVATFDAGSPATVLERLPASAAREGARVRDALARAQRTPDDLQAALQLARLHLQRAKSLGDAREAGRAQAALARWWSDPQAPDEVLLLRAAIRQHQHAFDDALADLDRLVGRSPPHLDGRWLLASLLQTLGRLDEARAHCERLDGAARVAGRVCVADIDSLRGDRDAVPRLLAELPDRFAASAPGAWVRLVLAEAAEREGRDEDAQAAFHAAVRDAATPYARVAYADWLLDRGRAAEVGPLLAGAPDTDAVLVRRAVALHRLGDPRAAELAAALADRLDAARRRGDPPHHREAARLALDLTGDAHAALAHARRNWTLQKEPADLLLLARAARAADDAAALAEVRGWIASQRWTDVRIALAGVAP